MKFRPLFFLSIFAALALFIAFNFQNEVGKNYPLNRFKLSKEFHEGRRVALRDKMPKNSVAFFFANPVRNRSNDVDFPYHQDPDFYYLSGFKETNALMIIFKEMQMINKVESSEILLVPPKDARWELWHGKRLGVDSAKTQLGFTSVFGNAYYKDLSLSLGSFKKVFYKPFKFQIKDNQNDNGDLFSLRVEFEQQTTKAKNLDDEELIQFMAELREVKQEAELKLLIRAISITNQAHVEVLKAVKPGVTEYQVQGVLEYMNQINGAKVGFPSIVGGAENSCVLHYTANNRKLHNGDIIVVDIGAEVAGYTADITRTIPVDGKFSEEQKMIYNLVLQAQKEAIKACKPGLEFKRTKEICIDIIKAGLIDFGIMSKKDDYKMYFMHGVSHYLGLDVHDVGTFEVLQEGNVITIEPGIYIKEGSPCDKKWWNIGVRIEDDVLITKDGRKVLSDALPKTVEAIELLMTVSCKFEDLIGNVIE